MKRNLEKYFANEDKLSLEKVLVIIKSVLAEQKMSFGRIGYVSGPIASEGQKKINKNLQFLKETAESLSLQLKYPIYSAPDLVTNNLYWKINGLAITPKHWEYFWEDLLRSGNITDIFMTPKWKISHGATEEHKIASQNGIYIHYL